MNELQVFRNAEFGEIRTVEQGGDTWFIANDVCRALELDNSRQALSRLDEDEKDVTLNDTLGGMQTMAIINESGLYSLVLSSRKPEAKEQGVPVKTLLSGEVEALYCNALEEKWREEDFEEALKKEDEDWRWDEEDENDD